jgi:NAD+ synthase
MENQKCQLQQEIIEFLKVLDRCEPLAEVERRVAFLARHLHEQQGTSYVLGISGGIDSATAGRLGQLAVERIRSQGGQARFVAMRLPYGDQKDEDEAQRALQFIQPDRIVTVDIKPAVDAMFAALGDTLHEADPARRDFLLGNIKSRQRMIAQYALAGAHDGLVLGTHHAAEGVMGFFTKYGDGAFDVSPLTDLNKRQVRALAEALGAPASLLNKTPTADLENLSPQKPDEAAFGVTYDEIDDFLEARPVSEEAFEKIVAAYCRTKHKRALPARPPAT